MFNWPPKKDKQRIKCPACKEYNCYKHCNNCSADIYFKKDELDKWHCYDELTQDIHECMKKGTRSGKFLDVNKKQTGLFDTGNFYNLCVVQERDNRFVKDAKIALYQKLTGHGLVRKLKQRDLNYLREWEAHSFEY